MMMMITMMMTMMIIMVMMMIMVIIMVMMMMMIVLFLFLEHFYSVACKVKKNRLHRLINSIMMIVLTYSAVCSFETGKAVTLVTID